MKPKDIKLHVNELVLHGFAPTDSHRIGVAMERELTRLLARHDVAAALSMKGSVVSVDGGSFNTTSDATPNLIGTRVAECVYRGLSR